MTPRVEMLGAAVLLALACTGCAQTGLPAVNTEGVVLERGERTVRSPRVTAQIEQHGSEVTIAATGSCDLRRFRTVERRIPHSESAPKDPHGALGLWALGALAVGTDAAGAMVLGGALSTRPRSPSKAVGGALLGAVGLTLSVTTLWIATHDDRPSSYTRWEPVREEVDEGAVQEDVPCGEVRSVPAHTPVIGKLPGPREVTEVRLGETDTNGGLWVDLAKGLDLTGHAGVDLPKTMPVYIRGRYVGRVDLER